MSRSYRDTLPEWVRRYDERIAQVALPGCPAPPRGLRLDWRAAVVVVWEPVNPAG
jgi:hypothetical protein